MSEKSANLKLPFIQSAQAQKHITHNDAITNLDILTQLTVEDKDLAIPPLSPTEGACYIVANAATAEWSGKENQLAAWQDGAWRFYEPAEGWVAWIKDEDTQTVYDDSTWNVLNNSGGGGSTNLNPVTGGLVGINATADTTNKLSLNSDASLFNHDGTDHQLKINKNLASNNASVLFQTGFSGRAEFGITGDDDFHMKVSPDGATFYDGIVIDKDTGEVSFPNTTFSGGGTAVNSVYGRTGNVIAETNDYTFDQIGGVSQNVLMGRLTSGTGVQEALSASQVRSFLNIEDNATADQTGSEIKSLLFTEADTNNFDDAQQSKLAAIEPAATADQTGAEIKALYEAEANTNAFDDLAVSKLSAIEPLADVTDEANVVAAIDGASLATASVNSTDKVLIQDVSDGNNLKTVTVQSIANLSSGSGGAQLSNTELLMMQLRIADLEGDAAVLTDGIIDPFDDETDVDTASSSNQIYMATEGKYGGSSDGTAISNSFGSVIGDMTGGSGLQAPFDGVNSTDNTATAYQGTAGTTFGYIGKNATSSPKKISQVVCYGAVSYGYAGGSPNITIDLYGKNGTAPSGPTDGSLLGTSSQFLNSAGAIVTINSSDTNTNWDFFWVTITPTSDFAHVAEVMFYEPSTPANMVIQSNAFTADSSPDQARIFVQIETAENIALNTDLLVSASRDNGTNWVVGTLEDSGFSVNGVKLYDANNIDLSGQTSGAEMKWKIETLNNKLMSIHGIGLKWS
ncbi:MAG: DUF2793 domain-containing protein [Rhizobiales bacterium]|nr:DUF2793 domain-containing protein [Hyphomicrobiales bacterium]